MSLLASIFTGPDAAPNGMLYDLPLKPVGITLGLLLLVSHLAALVFREPLRASLPKFPRSPQAGFILLTLAAIWAFIIVSRADLGELQPRRGLLMAAVVILYFMTLWQMREFLAARALGMILLLAAEPLLDAAFLRPQLSRLLLPALAYAWVLFGLFFVGMPWLVRDIISWATATTRRFSLLLAAGAAYGLTVLACALLFY